MELIYVQEQEQSHDLVMISYNLDASVVELVFVQQEDRLVLVLCHLDLKKYSFRTE